jgi:NAD(P)H dehydrogenase (quinone)
MRALVIYCHPRRGSFTEAVRDVVMEKLRAAGAETRLRDLYAEGFDPVLSAREHEIYEDEAINRDPAASHCATLLGATR